MEAPLLTTYPNGVNVPGDLQLLHYKKKSNELSQFLYGETENLCYFSQRTFDGNDDDEDDDEKQHDNDDNDDDDNGVNAIEKVQTRFALGVFDPKTNTVQITPLSKVFRMKQKLLEVVNEDGDGDDDEKSSSGADKDKQMNARDYVADFGNARAKKAIRSDERYNLIKTSKLEKAMANTGKGAGYRAVYPEYFPVPNKSATVARDIFPLGSFMSESLLLDLGQVTIDKDFLAFTQGRKLSVNNNNNGNKTRNASLPSSPLEKIPRVVQELLELDADYFKEDSNQELTRLALYLTFLIWMYNAPPRFTSKNLKDALERNAEALSEFKKVKLVAPNKRMANHLVNMFTTRSVEKKVSKSKENMDKLLAHIMLVYAHLRKFSIRFDCLHTDLKVPEESMEPFAKILGFEREFKATEGGDAASGSGAAASTWRLRAKRGSKKQQQQQSQEESQ